MIPCCRQLSGACFKHLRFTKSSQKTSKKSQNSRFLISTVRKLLSEVEPYRTINNEVDVAKKCCQIWQKVAKVAKKCYQMWQKVAKGVLSGSKRFQGLPRACKGFLGIQAETVFSCIWSRNLMCHTRLLKMFLHFGH